MYGCGPVLLPIFLAVFLYCPLSLSFAHCLPTFSSTSGKVLSADIQRCRWMLYVSGELSLVGCYLRLHPCLEELTPTHPLQLMVTRVLMALGTENVDGFEGPHWSAAQATWFWSVRSEIQWPSSPSKSSFKSFSGFTCTLNIFFCWIGIQLLISSVIYSWCSHLDVQFSHSLSIWRGSLPLIYQ